MIKRWIKNWIFELEKCNQIELRRERDRLCSNTPVTFTLHPAEGGTVVEINGYDVLTDRASSGLHVITADQDLGEGLSRIFTIYQLKK